MISRTQKLTRSACDILPAAFDKRRKLLDALCAPLGLRAPRPVAATKRISGQHIVPNSMFANAVMAVAAAAVISAAITVFTSAGQVEARAPVQVMTRTGADSRPIGPLCAQREWPYYEAHCVRDLRPASTHGRTPRIVAIDRW